MQEAERSELTGNMSSMEAETPPYADWLVVGGADNLFVFSPPIYRAWCTTEVGVSLLSI